MDIKNLTPEEKKALKAQFIAEERDNKARAQAEKATFKTLQNDFVATFFPKLVAIADDLTLSKAELFETAKTILDLKQGVFGISAEEFGKQQSHTFSNADCSKSILLGHNVVDDWDLDVAGAGVARVNEWLTKRITEQNATLINIIRDLLKPNKDGMLKANRVLELFNQAQQIGDQELIDAVAMIQEAYRPKKTSTFVKAKFKDEDGRDMWLNLSMSNA